MPVEIPGFVRTENPPYSTFYTLTNFVGSIEVFVGGGQIRAQIDNHREWHQFRTLQAAVDWLTVKAVEQRMKSRTKKSMNYESKGSARTKFSAISTA